MDELIAELAAAAWFEAVRIRVLSSADLNNGNQVQAVVTLGTVLGGALRRLNPHLPQEAIDGAMRILARPPHPTLIQNNRWFHAMPTDCVEVEYRDLETGETRGGRRRLVDFDDPLANDLLVVRQLTVTGSSGKTIRLDLVVFLTGPRQSDAGADHGPQRPGRPALRHLCRRSRAAAAGGAIDRERRGVWSRASTPPTPQLGFNATTTSGSWPSAADRKSCCRKTGCAAESARRHP